MAAWRAGHFRFCDGHIHGLGIHGIDHMETGALDKDPVPSFDELYYDFCETVHGLDENVGRVLNRLDKLKLTDDTLVIYLGDNGLALGVVGRADRLFIGKILNGRRSVHDGEAFGIQSLLAISFPQIMHPHLDRCVGRVGFQLARR